MSKMSELAYDIEQLYIEGLNARYIAKELGCPVEMVLTWIESQSVADTQQEDNPYANADI